MEEIKVMKKLWFVFVAVLVVIWLVVTNIFVEVNTISVSYTNLPDAFDGFKIVQISDFHNAEYANDNAALIDDVSKVQPDIIAITGDFVDSDKTDIQVALEFAAALSRIAPCYYVTGNHEARLSFHKYKELEDGLLEVGVTVLRNREALIEKEGEQIAIIGLDDPNFGKKVTPQTIDRLNTTGDFSIVLAHRPEYFERYQSSTADLVLAGHAHGGQVRIPLVGGLLAPGQGLFPKYDAGLYQEGDFAMVVSRGIGNSAVPVRVNNQPEIVVIELNKEK